MTIQEGIKRGITHILFQKALGNYSPYSPDTITELLKFLDSKGVMIEIKIPCQSHPHEFEYQYEYEKLIEET